nr:hypothetical protein [uncultured Janthinobacterium sp.]
MKEQRDRSFRHVGSITPAKGRYFPISDDPGIVVASCQGAREDGGVTAFSVGL